MLRSNLRSAPIPLLPLSLSRHIRYASTEPSKATTPVADYHLPKSTETAVSSLPVTHPPPAPPAPLSAIPPKITDLAQDKEATSALAKKDDKPKGTMPQRAWATVKKEAAHYWAGTKLLGSEIKISSKLAWKVLNGSTLTRRERRQVSRMLDEADDPSSNVQPQILSG